MLPRKKSENRRNPIPAPAAKELARPSRKNWESGLCNFQNCDPSVGFNIQNAVINNGSSLEKDRVDPPAQDDLKRQMEVLRSEINVLQSSDNEHRDRDIAKKQNEINNIRKKMQEENGKYLRNRSAQMMQDMKNLPVKQLPKMAKRKPFALMNEGVEIIAKEDNKKVEVLQEECTNAAIQLKQLGYKKVAVINFANFSVLGGGWLVGASAQEEYLTRVSTLGYSLLCFFMQSVGVDKANQILLSSEENFKNEVEVISYAYFKNGRPHYAPGSIGLDVLFSTNLLTRGKSKQKDDGFIFRYEKLETPVEVDFITSAALIHRNGYFEEDVAGYPIKVISPAMERAIHTAAIYNQIKTAIEECDEAIVAGAFGCGAFLNNPYAMAELYWEIASLPEFIGKIKIWFAISDKDLAKIFEDKFEKPLEVNLESANRIRQDLNNMVNCQNDKQIKNLFSEIAKCKYLFDQGQTDLGEKLKSLVALYQMKRYEHFPNAKKQTLAEILHSTGNLSGHDGALIKRLSNLSDQDPEYFNIINLECSTLKEGHPIKNILTDFLKMTLFKFDENRVNAVNFNLGCQLLQSANSDPASMAEKGLWAHELQHCYSQRSIIRFSEAHLGGLFSKESTQIREAMQEWIIYESDKLDPIQQQLLDCLKNNTKPDLKTMKEMLSYASSLSERSIFRICVDEINKQFQSMEKAQNIVISADIKDKKGFVKITFPNPIMRNKLLRKMGEDPNSSKYILSKEADALCFPAFIVISGEPGKPNYHENIQMSFPDKLKRDVVLKILFGKEEAPGKFRSIAMSPKSQTKVDQGEGKSFYNISIDDGVKKLDSGKCIKLDAHHAQTALSMASSTTGIYQELGGKPQIEIEPLAPSSPQAIQPSKEQFSQDNSAVEKAQEDDSELQMKKSSSSSL